MSLILAILLQEAEWARARERAQAELKPILVYSWDQD